MHKERFKIENIPAVLYGEKSDKLYLFVHGKHSCKEEAESFAKLAVPRGYQVLSFDLPEHGERQKDCYKCSVQNGVHDLQIILNSIREKYRSLSLYACSLGAYFSLMAYGSVKFEKCLFVSPVLDMERLIKNMMMWSKVTEEALQSQKEIETPFGETLSWEYYEYVKSHPVREWNNDTFILYGEMDNLTERSILDSFSEKYMCKVDVLAGGEHHFHTPEQLGYLENWLRDVTA